MHHVVLEGWSRGASALHRRDPRAKLGALVVFLIVVATAQRGLPYLAGGLLALLAATLAWARVPLGAALARAAAVLPLTALFGAICWLGGDPARAVAVVIKSYLSALAVLTVVASTPLPLLLRGLEAAGAPGFLVLVVQFLYRYLFVISEEAQHMRAAARARGVGGRIGWFDFAARRRFLRAAGGALAVLFVRSYARAEEIHHAMLARAFGGRFHTLGALDFRPSDVCFLTVASLAPVLARVAVERLA